MTTMARKNPLDFTGIQFTKHSLLNRDVRKIQIVVRQAQKN